MWGELAILGAVDDKERRQGNGGFHLKGQTMLTTWTTLSTCWMSYLQMRRLRSSRKDCHFARYHRGWTSSSWSRMWKRFLADSGLKSILGTKMRAKRITPSILFGENLVGCLLQIGMWSWKHTSRQWRMRYQRLWNGAGNCIEGITSHFKKGRHYRLWKWRTLLSRRLTRDWLW